MLQVAGVRLAFVLVICACTRDALEAHLERMLLARRAIAISASIDADLVEYPEDAGVFQHAVVERRTGRIIAERRARTRMLAPTWRPDGRAIAYAASDGTRRFELRIWDFAAGDRTLGLPATSTSLLRFSPDGARLAYLADRRMLTVVELATGSARTLAEIADRSELAWSPDGTQLVTSHQPGTLAVFDVTGARVREVRVNDGELRDFAWSRAGEIVVTGRGRDDEWLRLYRVGGSDAAAAVANDVHAPRFCGDALVVHVERDGERRVIVGTAQISRDDASTVVVACDATRIVAIERTRDRPPTVLEVGAGAAAVPAAAAVVPDDAASRIAAARLESPARAVLDRGSTSRLEGTAGQRISIGVLPAYRWAARRARGAVVFVHGGPALHATPAWSERTQLLLDAGYDVVKLDYRGSTGHGARFEARGTVEDRVADVLAAREHAARAAGIDRTRVVLVGESYGAGLVALATARDHERSPAVLIGTIGLAAVPADAAPARGTCSVDAFHGALDDVAPRDDARAYVARLFARVRWVVLAREGHNIARTRSWAAIYAAILRARC